MKAIGITDHDYAYGYKAKNIEAVRKIIQKCESPIPIHFGVEAHILEYRVASINIQLASYFDYVLMAPNHYHLRGGCTPLRSRQSKKELRTMNYICLKPQSLVR